MINEAFLNEHFYPKFYHLDEENILRMNEAYNDARINNVIVGLHKECYGLMLSQDSINYNLYYINNSTLLEGCLLQLSLNESNTDSLLLAFCMNIADTYNIDVLYTFNTYQDAIRSMFESEGYYTILASELQQTTDTNPLLIAKNVKGIKVIPFLYHSDLFQFIFGAVEFVQPDEGVSYVYLMHNKRNNLIKIGKSKNPGHREKTLQAEEPEIRMIAVWQGSNKLERDLHRLYKHKRLRGEWFNLSFRELKNLRQFIAEYPY